MSGRAAWLLGIGRCATTLWVGCLPAHSEGRETTEPARRVVSLVPSATTAILALGGRDRLVGRTDYDRDPLLREVTSVGGALDPSVERIVALRPDLIIGWRSGADPSVERQVVRLGLPVRRVGTETLGEMRETIHDLGRWLGLEGRSASLLQAIDETLAAVRASAAARGRTPSVFYAVWVDPQVTAGPRTFVSELIALAGGRNVFADAPVNWPTVSLESVIRRDPDLVIWPRSPESRPWRAMVRDHPAWRQVRAVREARVLEVDGDLFNRPGPGLAEAARQLSQALDVVARHANTFTTPP